LHGHFNGRLLPKGLHLEHGAMTFGFDVTVAYLGIGGFDAEGDQLALPGGVLHGSVQILQEEVPVADPMVCR
jgi:hypothetical protein